MDVYQPAEDSYLLAKYVEMLVSGRVLDMGTGSGIQAVTAALKPEVSHVSAVDVNPIALKAARNRAAKEGIVEKLDFVFSDLFAEVSGKYDWILFNAPYLPSEGEPDEPSWAGGETGSEVIKRFLVSAPNHLTDNGSILMIYSSHSGMIGVDFSDYKHEILEEMSLFFEKLYCVRLSPS